MLCNRSKGEPCYENDEESSFPGQCQVISLDQEFSQSIAGSCAGDLDPSRLPFAGTTQSFMRVSISSDWKSYRG